MADLILVIDTAIVVKPGQTDPPEKQAIATVKVVM
jgi:hypothetical protein